MDLTDWAIAAFLLLGCAWDIEPVLRRRIWGPLHAVVNWAGLWHTWRMFAPDPIAVNRRLQAKIIAESGKVVSWTSPNFRQMGLFEAFLRARERKFYGNVMSSRDNYLRASFSLYLAETLLPPGERAEKIVLTNEIRPIVLDSDEEPELVVRVAYEWNAPRPGR